MPNYMWEQESSKTTIRMRVHSTLLYLATCLQAFNKLKRKTEEAEEERKKNNQVTHKYRTHCRKNSSTSTAMCTTYALR